MSLLVLLFGLLAAAVSGLSLYLFASGVTDLFSSPVPVIRKRVRQISVGEVAKTPEAGGLGMVYQAVTATTKGWSQRATLVVMPLVNILDRAGSAADPVRLRQAGVGSSISADEMKRARAWFGIIAAGALALLGLGSGLANALLFAVLGFVLGVRIPSFLLASAATKRVNACIRSLPEMIDMIALGSRAGMTFDNAIAMYAERFDGPLADEFGRALEKWHVGADSREHALDEVAESLDLDVIRRFVSAVIQAMRLGSPLARVLDEQGSDARKAQKLALEAEIAKAPVKMFIPLGTLILPAMLILLLGPVVIQIMTSFSGL